jgi:5-formyltetrahydrofolate cyclo-ligase
VISRFDGEMDFSIPIHPSDWSIGVFGNPEPRTELPETDPGEIDAIVVPGVVFGAGGERIGRGAGFYDRYLSRARSALRIGFAFDFQLLEEEVPQSEWDARMDVIVTDRRIVEPSGGPRSGRADSVFS